MYGEQQLQSKSMAKILLKYVTPCLYHVYDTQLIHSHDKIVIIAKKVTLTLRKRSLISPYR